MRDLEGEKGRESELKSTERLLVLHSTLEIKEFDKRRGREATRYDFEDPTDPTSQK